METDSSRYALSSPIQEHTSHPPQPEMLTGQEVTIAYTAHVGKKPRRRPTMQTVSITPKYACSINHDISSTSALMGYMA